MKDYIIGLIIFSLFLLGSYGFVVGVVYAPPQKQTKDYQIELNRDYTVTIYEDNVIVGQCPIDSLGIVLNNLQL